MPLTLDQRLERFPTRDLNLAQDVELRWNAHAVPYISAQTDGDAAYTLGLVHVHLRAAQLQIMKRIAQGRVAEMLGPFAVDLDHALRLLDLPGAARACEAQLPAQTRAWLEPFVRGLNDAQSQLRELPPEFRWLALRAEPWTLTDVLTLGRLAGADVNWSSYLGLLAARGKRSFAALWQRLRIVGGTAANPLARAIAQFARSGSNSVAISGTRTASGKPLMANDPHLGQSLPNFWLLVGLRCPSYQMVGLMPPGLPFVGVGASPHAAWGGTNMRAASSELVDVSTIAAPDIRSEDTVIRVRGLGTRTRRIRRTPQGPILNDARLLRVSGGPVALRWAGAQASDEIGAFLRAAQARKPEDFHAAFATFCVCAQNILFATRAGDIGHLYAAHLPRREGWPQDTPILSPARTDTAWSKRWDSTSLPLTVNPDRGYRVSANDRPQFTDAPLGFFFSEGDRAARLAELAAQQDMTLEHLRAQQRDTRVPGAARLAQELCTLLQTAGADARVIAALHDWNGDYAADAVQPVLFECLLHTLALGLQAPGAESAMRELDDEWGRHTRLLLPELEALPLRARRALLLRAARVARIAGRRYRNWGQMHRLRIGHLLSLLPVLGRGLRVADLPVGGTRESPMKNSHGLTRRRHSVQYGAQARHLSDLADPDSNHFVLLGGNDGWIGSANYADQIPLWIESRYLRLPLGETAIAQEFGLRTMLRAAARVDEPATPETVELESAT